LYPEIVVEVPPALGPAVGETPVTTGAVVAPAVADVMPEPQMDVEQVLAPGNAVTFDWIRVRT